MSCARCGQKTQNRPRPANDPSVLRPGSVPVNKPAPFLIKGVAETDPKASIMGLRFQGNGQDRY